MLRLMVNDEEFVCQEPERSLLNVLRGELGLMGTRTGCGIGECGACTVLVDDEPVQSCITPLGEVADRRVTTPEGLGAPTDPSDVQSVFLDEQAGQCGYCINGMIVQVTSLVRQDGPIDESTLRASLDGHICRCGTQTRILRAARRILGLELRDSNDEVIVRPMATGEQASLPPGGTVEERLRMLDDGRIEVLAGKVEIGQGIRTALRQIVAAGVGVSVDFVTIHATVTGLSPDESYTAGSASIEEGGEALAWAASAFRRILLEYAAELLGTSPERLRIEGDRIASEAGTGLRFSDIAEAGGVRGQIRPDDAPRWSGGSLGESVPRDDLVDKLTGAPAYVHDLTFPDMVHARVLLPPTYDATPAELDLEEALSLPGVLDVHREARLVLVVARTEEQATRAVRQIARTARWSARGLPVGNDTTAWLTQPAEQTHVVHDDELPSGKITRRARYTKPYEAHAPMAPSCAVALEDENGMISVWTHSQGVYPLRRELAALLGLEEQSILVEHADGPGCYGHNNADDAAAFAALACRRVPGRPVRFQFGLEDEFTWEPYGSAMSAELEGVVGADGRVAGWRHVVRSDVHSTRPNGDGDRLVPSWLIADRVRSRSVIGEQGARNASPLYAFPRLDVRADYSTGPLRVSALRSLGAFMNVFASESFVDELAEAADADPLEFRLAHLSDSRAREVLEVIRDRSGWEPHVGPSGRGRGVALARYKGSKAYVALVVDADVDVESGLIRVERVTAVCDAGRIVNPDGLRNQLEGGILQGLSRSLHEHIQFNSDGIQSRDWTNYPVLRFSGVPDVELALIDRPNSQPLGAGEASTPPVPAALANAIDDAIGIRLRELPFTYQRLEQRLLTMTDEEAARVQI